MPIDAGKLDRRVEVQARTTTRGASGGAVVAYATEQTIWAQQVEVGGTEARRSGAMRAEANLILRIRYRSTLTTQHRLLYQSKYYDILEIKEEGRRESQLVQCKHTEGVP